MTTSEKAQEYTLTVESLLTSDIRHETAPRGTDTSLAPLVERLKDWQSEKVLFVAPTKGDAMKLRELLSSYDLNVPVVEEPVPVLLARGEFERTIVDGHLNQKFRLPKAHLVVMTFDEIFGTQKR